MALRGHQTLLEEVTYFLHHNTTELEALKQQSDECLKATLHPLSFCQFVGLIFHELNFEW